MRLPEWKRLSIGLDGCSVWQLRNRNGVKCCARARCLAIFTANQLSNDIVISECRDKIFQQSLTLKNDSGLHKYAQIHPYASVVKTKGRQTLAYHKCIYTLCWSHLSYKSPKGNYSHRTRSINPLKCHLCLHGKEYSHKPLHKSCTFTFCFDLMSRSENTDQNAPLSAFSGADLVWISNTCEIMPL